MSSKPVFEHDCDRCIFLAHFEGKDLYFCPGEPTVIARHSSDGGDYSSGLPFADRPLSHPQHNRYLRVAWLLAKDSCIHRITKKDFQKAVDRGFEAQNFQFLEEDGSYIVSGNTAWYIPALHKNLSLDDIFFPQPSRVPLRRKVSGGTENLLRLLAALHRG